MPAARSFFASPSEVAEWLPLLGSILQAICASSVHAEDEDEDGGAQPVVRSSQDGSGSA